MAQRDAAEKQRSGGRLACCGKVSDMVIDIVGARGSHAETLRPSVEGGRDFQLFALLPDRRIVVEAVVAYGIYIAGGAKVFGAGHWTRHDACHHYGFEPQLADRVIQLCQCFFGGGHRNCRNWL